MISLFRKPKWRIRYVDAARINPEKYILLKAKTIAHAKEEFYEVYKNVKIISIIKLD